MPRHRVGLALAAKDLGDAKVANLYDHAVFVKKDVLGLEVPVQDEVGVYVMQREQDLNKEVQDGLLLQQGITALLDELSQGAAWCVFHGDHESLVLQEVLVVLDDIGVVEQLEDLALILGCLPLFLGHLLHWDLLDDDQLLVRLAQTQVYNPYSRSFLNNGFNSVWFIVCFSYSL